MRLIKIYLSALASTGVLAAAIEYGSAKGSKPYSPVVASINDGFITQKNRDEFESDTSESNTIEIPEICSKDQYVIHSQADLDVLSDLCHDIMGSIIVSNYYGPVIDTGDILTIGGDFVIVNATSLVRVQLSKVAAISGMFKLNELTALTAVNAPALNTVRVIDWRILPILSTVNFDNGISEVKSITISDTSLVGFSGFEVDSLETLNINNNRFMEIINSNLRGINEKLSISANAKNAVVALPNLEYANNVTIRDVGSLSLPSIEGVNASMELINNNFLSIKFPKLKHIGGTLSLIENFNMKDVEFPTVEDVGGGLMVVNNTMLNKINFLPKLSIVGGAIEFVGDFKEAIFSKLSLVRGSAQIKSVSDSFDCSRWIRGDDQNGTTASNSIIRGGKIVCTSGNMQQTVKYDQDGAVLDEDISFIDDHESDDAKVGNDTSSGAHSTSVTKALLGGYIILAGSHSLGLL
ncbi:Sporulation-specific protein 22 [Cyberlindnera fabianii]|uniref:Sporulation-specific protein 22 n=1 Tax=Cyberlindnera fabianii TaxID=36022 RepID=A0A1V2L9H8_CYBFA|nr:Sporulation-specific protein 22 [Cyberlindnera fabianii]